MKLYGRNWKRDELDALIPDIAKVAGIRQFAETDGPASGARLIQIDSGGGLRVELLPDRCCDIGQVWCNDVPFGWTGPIGMSGTHSVGENTSLSGLMSTCGFDHIRQPDTDEGRSYPLHGRMARMPAKIVSCVSDWDGDNCNFRVLAEATQFVLGQATVRLEREIVVPLGGRTLALTDRVTVLSGSLPLMAMYHINFGFPLAGPGSRLTLAGKDIPDALSPDGIRTRSSGAGLVQVVLSGGGEAPPRYTLAYDGDALPCLQTLRNATDGTNLFCIEPATHEKQPRAALREADLLEPSGRGATRVFRLHMAFDPGGYPAGWG
ncbi:DUF4432 family protein [Martelella sp. AMO21009]